MSQVLPPRMLRRVANILDREADVIGTSYGLVTEGQTWDQRAKDPKFPDPGAQAAREFREYRRLAARLREAAG